MQIDVNSQRDVCSEAGRGEMDDPGHVPLQGGPLGGLDLVLSAGCGPLRSAGERGLCTVQAGHQP